MRKSPKFDQISDKCAGKSDTVATVGLWKQEPNIYNSIPRHVQLDIDIRDTDNARRDAVLKTAFDAAAEIAARRKCNHTSSTVFKYPVGVSDPKVCADPVASVESLLCSSVKLTYKYACLLLAEDVITILKWSRVFQWVRWSTGCRARLMLIFWCTTTEK